MYNAIKKQCHFNSAHQLECTLLKKKSNLFLSTFLWYQFDLFLYYQLICMHFKLHGDITQLGIEP